MTPEVVTLCSFIAVFFSKAKTASVVGALLFFLLYFPFLLLRSKKGSHQNLAGSWVLTSVYDLDKTGAEVALEDTTSRQETLFKHTTNKNQEMLMTHDIQ